MIELRPSFADVEVALDALAVRGGGELAIELMLRRGRCVWPWDEGVYVLVRWAGERQPLPAADPLDGAPAFEIVGVAPFDDSKIDEFADVADIANTVYHYALLAIGGGGAVPEIDPLQVQERSIDGAGNVRGLMPNAPSALDVGLLAGNRPHLAWAYSRVYEQAAPSVFRIYQTDGASAFNFAAPAASVPFIAGVTRYDWLGPALNAGDERYWTVRAESAAGVLSLIPRIGDTPSPDYDAVPKLRCPGLIVPSVAPAAPDNFALEATP